MRAEPNFEGHAERECGEHRTVGSHRAWCHDCHEWCYPSDGCRGCKAPKMERALDTVRDALTKLQTWDMLTLDAEGDGQATADAPWARGLIAKALEALEHADA